VRLFSEGILIKPLKGTGEYKGRIYAINNGLKRKF